MNILDILSIPVNNSSLLQVPSLTSLVRKRSVKIPVCRRAGVKSLDEKAFSAPSLLFSPQRRRDLKALQLAVGGYH